MGGTRVTTPWGPFPIEPEGNRLNFPFQHHWLSLVTSVVRHTRCSVVECPLDDGSILARKRVLERLADRGQMFRAVGTDHNLGDPFVCE
jgi:hypothetical protein